MNITTQAELDAAPKGEWHDLGPGRFIARNGSTVDAYEGSTVYARSGSTVYAWDGSTVYDWNGNEWVERGAKEETPEIGVPDQARAEQPSDDVLKVFGGTTTTLISDIIDALGDWHDEGYCDGPQDLIDEIKAVVAKANTARAEGRAEALAEVVAKGDAEFAVAWGNINLLEETDYAYEWWKGYAAGIQRSTEQAEAIATVRELGEK